jgi:cysteine-rich repeat protein
VALLVGSSCGGRTSETERKNDRQDKEGAAGGSLSASGGQDGMPEPTWPLTCGDGQLDPGEECDDKNLDNGDGCDSNCCVVSAGVQACSNGWCPVDHPCHCGDGALELGEECDDGNLSFGDGCNGFCEVETGLCGNQVLDQGEECDDGNFAQFDGCAPNCLAEFSLVPTCSDSLDECACEGDECVCGNGTVQDGEQCDDGNLLNEDGCSSQCLLECGDGNLSGDEECDDGNHLFGDGCDETCHLEDQIEPR